MYNHHKFLYNVYNICNTPLFLTYIFIYCILALKNKIKTKKRINKRINSILLRILFCFYFIFILFYYYILFHYYILLLNILIIKPFHFILFK